MKFESGHTPVRWEILPSDLANDNLVALCNLIGQYILIDILINTDTEMRAYNIVLFVQEG